LTVTVFVTDSEPFAVKYVPGLPPFLAICLFSQVH
jgi:hypothetical protein